MNLLIAAQSGFGKSYLAQAKTEKNIEDVEFFIALDYDDEYRGLVEGFDDVKWHPIGPKEIAVSPREWAQRLEKCPKMVMPRYMIADDEWRRVCGALARALRVLNQQREQKARILALIDEAHGVAPQEQGYPESIKKLAVDGRGENMSCIWVTQRLAMLSKNITSQCTARYLGGFMDSNDLDALTVEYPDELHNPTITNVRHCPEDLMAEDGWTGPVRKWTDEQGNLIGSEWIYSDDSGDLWRESTHDLTMRTTHYGEQGYTLDL